MKFETPLFKTILVTGCGGDIGIAIARIIRSVGIAVRLIGCDTHQDHPAAAFVEDLFTVPRATALDYWPRISDLILREQVDIVIPAAEPELRLFDSDGVEAILGAKVIRANDEASYIGYDKLRTARALESWGLPYPETLDATEGFPSLWPSVLKARGSSGSKNVRIVCSPNEAPAAENLEGLIWQELLLPDDEEYTCGLYGSASDSLRSVAFRRKLVGGLTGSGQVVVNDEIDSLLRSIAKGLRLRGSINVQLRYTERGPVVFEINPRFSSTVMFRHLLGFQDVIWSLLEAAGKPLPPYISPLQGTRFYRVGSEVIL